MEVQLDSASDSLKRFLKGSTDAHAVLMQAFEAYKESKDLKSYKTVEAQVIEQHGVTMSKIMKIVKSTQDVDKSYSERVSLIQVLLDDRMTMTSTYLSKMIDFISKASSGVSADAKSSMMKTVNAFEKDVSQIDDKIKKAELKIV